MKKIESNYEEYADVEYLQFNKSNALKIAESIAGILTWPLVIPLALLSRFSDLAFRTVSEALSIIPYVFGIIFRYEFYRFALSRVGKNVQIEFGTIFIYRDIEIGSDVLIGRYNIIHHCDFGDSVLIGERCTFLSGSQQHSYDRLDVPMCRQGGRKKRIRIASDCWIGSHAVVMASVAGGSIVAAGAVVTKPVGGMSIVGGNPAALLADRSAKSNGSSTTQ